LAPLRLRYGLERDLKAKLDVQVFPARKASALVVLLAMDVQAYDLQSKIEYVTLFLSALWVSI
jgi:hypothetical protein